MAIRILKNDTEAVNLAINKSCDMIYDIEDLLARGPKQLEAYTALLKVLKLHLAYVLQMFMLM